jgi:hypothetical protein
MSKYGSETDLLVLMRAERAVQKRRRDAQELPELQWDRIKPRGASAKRRRAEHDRHRREHAETSWP